MPVMVTVSSMLILAPWLTLHYIEASRVNMLDTSVPIRTLKLSNIGPGWETLQEVPGSAGTAAVI